MRKRDYESEAGKGDCREAGKRIGCQRLEGEKSGRPANAGFDSLNEVVACFFAREAAFDEFAHRLLIRIKR